MPIEVFLLIAGVIVCFILYCFFEERSKKRAEMKEIEENARRKREEEERLKKVEERYSNSSILKQAVDKIVDITPRPLCVRVDSVCIEVYKSRVPELRRYANESSSVEDMPMLGDSWASMRFDHSEKYATKTLYFNRDFNVESISKEDLVAAGRAFAAALTKRSGKRYKAEDRYPGYWVYDGHTGKQIIVPYVDIVSAEPVPQKLAPQYKKW